MKLEQARKTAETDVIMKALYSTQWNRKRSAALLGIDYKALLYKMKKLGLIKSTSRAPLASLQFAPQPVSTRNGLENDLLV